MNLPVIEKLINLPVIISILILLLTASLYINNRNKLKKSNIVENIHNKEESFEAKMNNDNIENFFPEEKLIAKQDERTDNSNYFEDLAQDELNKESENDKKIAYESNEDSESFFSEMFEEPDNKSKNHFAKVLAIISHKGGTAKTTTCINIAERYAGSGLKVLLIDIDPVMSAASFLNLKPPVSKGLIHETLIKNLKYIALQVKNKESLNNKIQEFRKSFDLIIFDTPSLQNEICRNSLSFFDYVLFTTTIDPLSIRMIKKGIEIYKDNLKDNKAQKFIGILATMIDAQNPLQISLIQNMTGSNKDIWVSEFIPADSKSKSRLYGFQEDSSSPSYKAYNLLFEKLKLIISEKSSEFNLKS